MADNKNQHYVPRVHLRPFSLNGEGNAINLCNLDRLQAIPHAPVKHQCSGDYFYGKDEKLETAINTIENPYGDVVRHLLADGAIGAPVDAVLRRFVYLQFLRTDAAARKASEMTLALSDVPGSDLPRPAFREGVKAAAQAMMRQYAKSMRVVDDLKLRIVRNRTDKPFVTSDNPAILTSRLHLQRIRRGTRSFSASSAGAIFVLPLSPTLLAILFDGDVYSADHRSRWIDVDRKSDVEALNEQQFLNCMANIYFHEWEGREPIIDAARKASPRRPATRHTITHAVLDETSDWGEHYVVRPITDIRNGEKVLVHVVANNPVPGAWPSFLRFRPDAKAWSNDTGAGLQRRRCVEQGFVSGVGYRKIAV